MSSRAATRTTATSSTSTSTRHGIRAVLVAMALMPQTTRQSGNGATRYDNVATYLKFFSEYTQVIMENFDGV